LSLYLRLNKERERGSLSIVVFRLLLIKLLDFPPTLVSCLVLYADGMRILAWFCVQIIGRILRKGKGHGEIGVPDRTREGGPGSDH
jgi:hypothetical protein